MTCSTSNCLGDTKMDARNVCMYHVCMYIEHKVTIMHRHCSYNTTIFAILHNVSTTCFGNFWFGHHQVRHNY